MSIKDRPVKRNQSIAWPVAHVMALAPLDVWIGMVRRSGGVHPRYWLRFGFIVVTSLIGTIATVHERVVLSIIRRKRFGTNHQINHQVIVIVGYYRTGTTHLQNLMSCDDRFVTPRWSQCLAGQGFVFGWAMIRFVLVPFLGQTRPQDAVGFGPNWPGEDDFALCSWGGCSSIPGRFIWPSQWNDWKRWHDLENLNEQELNRWRSLMTMFVWKITRGKKNRNRVVLLKTPSHTARIAELDRLFNGHVKFVHLVRDPGAVIDSNVRLHESLKSHLLEDGLDVQTIRDRIVEEYANTESKCGQEAKAIASDRFVRIRYQDLRNNAIGTMRSIYNTLGMNFDEQTQASIKEYLGRIGAYKSKKEEVGLGKVTDNEEMIKAEMIERYKLDAEPVARVAIEHVENESAKTWRGIGSGMLVAIGCITLWLGAVWTVHSIWPSVHPRLIPAVWVCGALIGMSVRKAAGNGSLGLGIAASTLTVFVVLSVAFPVSVINHNFASTLGYTTQDWLYHNAKYGLEGLQSVASMVFIVLGAVTAYRHGAANNIPIPGRSPKTDPEVHK